MSRPRVYIETTIPSFYFETRTIPTIVARREWTRNWWSNAGSRFELVTSAAVIEELKDGPSDRSVEWLDLIKEIPLIAIGEEIHEIVETYIRHHLMPSNPTGDALHLALASFH